MLLSIACLHIFAQGSIYSFRMNDVRIAIDGSISKSSHSILILYALRNGNTTEPTMGKQLQPGDDLAF